VEIEKGLLNFLRGSSENHKGQLSIFLEGEGGGGACLSHIGCRYEIILHVCRAIYSFLAFAVHPRDFYRIGFCYFSVVFFFFKIIRPGEGFGHHLWGKSSMYDLTRRNCPFMLFALVVSEKT